MVSHVEENDRLGQPGIRARETGHSAANGDHDRSDPAESKREGQHVAVFQPTQKNSHARIAGFTQGQPPRLSGGRSPAFSQSVSSISANTGTTPTLNRLQFRLLWPRPATTGNFVPNLSVPTGAPSRSTL